MSEYNYSTPDWAERLENGGFPVDMEKLEPLLNQDRAKKALQIFLRMKVPDVAGQPTNEQATGEWFQNIVRTSAGGLQKDGSQIVQTLLTLVPKKNGKSSQAAALMLTLVLISPRPNAEFLLIGPTQEIASIAYRQAEGIILADATLRSKFRIRQHLKRIEHIDSGCYLSIKSLDAKTVTGSKAAVTLVDECHLLTSEEAGRVIGQLKGAAAGIKESQLLLITTHSDKPESGWWKQELNKARKVRDGKAPDIEFYLPLTWEVPPKYCDNLVQACQPEVFSMVNPNLGRSVSMDWLKSAAKEALVTGEEELKRFLSQHLNLQVSGFTFTDDQWAGTEVWDSGARMALNWEWIINNCDQLAFGFDGGGADDLTSLAVIGRNGNEWYCATKSWVEPIALERRKSIAPLLKDFESEGDLKICASGQDVTEIGKFIKNAWDNGKLAALGCDPHGIAAELAEHLENDLQLPTDVLIAVPQGFRLRSGYLSLERKLKQNRLFHADQAVLNWAVSNTRQDKQTGLVTKKLSGVGKIDPVVALATAAMILNEAPEPVCVNALIG